MPLHQVLRQGDAACLASPSQDGEEGHDPWKHPPRTQDEQHAGRSYNRDPRTQPGGNEGDARDHVGGPVHSQFDPRVADGEHREDRERARHCPEQHTVDEL